MKIWYKKINGTKTFWSFRSKCQPKTNLGKNDQPKEANVYRNLKFEKYIFCQLRLVKRDKIQLNVFLTYKTSFYHIIYGILYSGTIAEKIF